MLYSVHGVTVSMMLMSFHARYYSCVRTEVTGVQLHNGDLLFMYILIRGGLAVLPCWFSKSDVLMIVDMHQVSK